MFRVTCGLEHSRLFPKKRRMIQGAFLPDSPFPVGNFSLSSSSYRHFANYRGAVSNKILREAEVEGSERTNSRFDKRRANLIFRASNVGRVDKLSSSWNEFKVLTRLRGRAQFPRLLAIDKRVRSDSISRLDRAVLD